MDVPRVDAICTTTIETATEASAAHGREEESSRSTSTVPRLYTHALESIFAFLKLADLATILAVSREWSAAVASMRPISATLTASRLNSSSASLPVVLSSGLARHIGSLGALYDEVFIDAPTMSLLPRLTHLHSLVAFFTQLHTLALSELPSPRAPAIVFPLKLAHLTLSVAAGISTAHLDAVLLAVIRLPLLRSFLLRLRQADLRVSFAPLLSLAQLEEFGLDWPSIDEITPSEAQVEEIRSMPHLTALRLDEPPTALLQTLFREPLPPFAAALRSLGQRTVVNADLSALLPSLPSLTELTGRMRGDADPACLSRLPHLTRLDLQLTDFHADSDDEPAESNRRLAASLRECTGLTALVLYGCRLTSDDVYTILQRMPRLRELELINATQLSSLCCFSTPPVCLTLQRLCLSVPSRPDPRPASEIVHLHALRGLTRLNLRDAFSDGPLGEESLTLFRPPALILPNLTRLEY